MFNNKSQTQDNPLLTNAKIVCLLLEICFVFCSRFFVLVSVCFVFVLLCFVFVSFIFFAKQRKTLKKLTQLKKSTKSYNKMFKTLRNDKRIHRPQTNKQTKRRLLNKTTKQFSLKQFAQLVCVFLIVCNERKRAHKLFLRNKSRNGSGKQQRLVRFNLVLFGLVWLNRLQLCCCVLTFALTLVLL